MERPSHDGKKARRLDGQSLPLNSGGIFHHVANTPSFFPLPGPQSECEPEAPGELRIIHRSVVKFRSIGLIDCPQLSEIDRPIQRYTHTSEHP